MLLGPQPLKGKGLAGNTHPIDRKHLCHWQGSGSAKAHLKLGSSLDTNVVPDVLLMAREDIRGEAWDEEDMDA